MFELFAQTVTAVPGGDPAAGGGAGFAQYLMLGLLLGSLYALIALGYTMVYGIIELINFAHGDLFMLGSMLALQVALATGVTVAAGTGSGAIAGTVLLMLVVTPVACAGLNVATDRLI
jgi:branched-chain amino acid transport system permease protein